MTQEQSNEIAARYLSGESTASLRIHFGISYRAIYCALDRAGIVRNYRKAYTADGKKYCPKCSDLKDVSEFYPSSKTKMVYSSYCKVCTKVRDKERWQDPEFRRKEYERIKQQRATNPEKFSERERRRLLSSHGLTIKEYLDLLAAQQGVCAICSFLPRENKPLFVDHCHETGKVRGLLCNNCNTALGMAKDSPKVLCAMIKYLEITNTAKDVS